MRTKLIGTIGVDSGQVMICDPCYVLKGDFEPEKFDKTNDYTSACRTTLSDKGAGIIDLTTGGDAAVSGTAYGDGTYPVYAEYGDDGQILRLTVELS